jgi:hypothetical protein
MQLFNFHQLESKILQVISFKSKGFCKVFRSVLGLQIIKLMNKKAEVKRMIKGQGERTFTKITTITHF